MSKLWRNIDRRREERERTQSEADRNVELEQWTFRSSILAPFWNVASTTGASLKLFHDIEIEAPYSAGETQLGWWRIERLSAAEEALRAALAHGTPKPGFFWDGPHQGNPQEATLRLMNGASSHGDEATMTILIWACAAQRGEVQRNSSGKWRGQWTDKVIDDARAFLRSKEEAWWNWNPGSKYLLPTWPQSCAEEDVDIVRCVQILGQDAAALLAQWRPVRITLLPIPN